MDEINIIYDENTRKRTKEEKNNYNIKMINKKPGQGWTENGEYPFQPTLGFADNEWRRQPATNELASNHEWKMWQQ